MKPIFISAIVALTIFGCKKTSTSTSISYTSGIGATRTWHGRAWGTAYDFDTSGNLVGTHYDRPDTQAFAIGIVNDSVISSGGHNFPLISADNVNEIFKFKYAVTGTESSIIYYRRGDSIHCYHVEYGVHTDIHDSLVTP
jgi:hypothetical protein